MDDLTRRSLKSAPQLSTPTPRERQRGIDRVINLLEALLHQRAPTRIGDIARLINAPRSSTYEIVNRLIEAEIGKANGRLARAEQIKAFRILPEELSLENGVMTPTRKKRRKQINERYQSLIASLYDETEEKLIKAEMGL